jgi:hypothetical protein
MTEINSLIQLQEIDSQLMDLEELQGDLPSKVEDLSSRLEEFSFSIHSAKARITEIDSEIRQLEGHESDRRTKVVKLKDQLYLVKTNREYDALMSEIDHLEEEIDTEENRELDLMQEKEQLEEQLKFDESQIGELEIELKTQAGELEKRVASSKEQETLLFQEREKIIPTINSRFMSIYDRIRQAKNGIAVVPIVDHNCGGCHLRITSQHEAEIRNGEGVYQCSSCRRILHWINTAKA